MAFHASGTFGPELILWMDESIIVISKPSGLLSLPDGYDRSKPHLRSLLEPQLGRLWIVHRLDRETSGVIVLARTASAHRFLNLQFDRGEVEKDYHAAMLGSPAWDSLRLELPLKVNGDNKHRTVPDLLHGKPARTDLTVLARRMAYSWVEAEIHSGRTHQIRAHAAALGHPLLGDRLYARGLVIDHPDVSRVALHALRLSLNHPESGQRLTFEAPYPDDLARLDPP
jgi:tRNA pseudouridine32 synthase/23S rRNA pseudouridine746 synthase